MNDDAFEKLRWLEPDETPFGVRCLDLRPLSRSYTSMTSDLDIVIRFNELRASAGVEHRGAVPESAILVACDLRYPHVRAFDEGPVFKAMEMEDKWDIYFFQDHLYFARSWTGALIFRASITFTGEEAVVDSIQADDEFSMDSEPLTRRMVDFLIKSHILGLEVPLPLPPGFSEDPRKIFAFAFNQYGRRASFAVFDDLTGTSMKLVVDDV
jgi:hypothetical protein